MKITSSNIKVKAKPPDIEQYNNYKQTENSIIIDNDMNKTVQATDQPILQNTPNEKRLFTKIVSNALSLTVGVVSFMIIFATMSSATIFLYQFKIIQYFTNFAGGYNLWSLIMTVIPSTIGALKISSVLGYPLKNGLVPSVIMLAIVLFLFSGYQFVYSVISFGLFSDFSWAYGSNSLAIIALSGDLCLKTSDSQTQQ